MKIRHEKEGIHYYDRRNGSHILVDEVRPQLQDLSIGPRTISIAITDDCDINCDHCHVQKGKTYLPSALIEGLCKDFDDAGTLDVALGGGEPTLHPDLIQMCRSIWENTSLGVSITTHGHRLNSTVIDSLKDYISILRISVDGIEPTYSRMRKRKLAKLSDVIAYLKGRIRFGINVVINSETIRQLDDISRLSRNWGAHEMLLLPIIVNGQGALTDAEWTYLDGWIKHNFGILRLRIPSVARKMLTCPSLFESDEWYDDYAYIAPDLTYRNDSFQKSGYKIADYASIHDLLVAWRRDMAAGGGGL
ncbi:MAG: radical SAM protein [candidate division Zixibacteria bacterium]|nr:radical SAM protein [candidate division Zixibacteria bacterium]